MTTRSDDDLITGLREDRSWAVEIVSGRIEPIIRAKIYAGDEWEDVRQQCLVEVVSAVRNIHRIENLWGLVRRITVCRVIDHNRQVESRRARLESSEDITATVAASQTETAHDARVADQELFLYVFQRLAEGCQRVFRMLFLEGRSYPEAARSLDISEGNLRVRLKRCRDKALALRKQAMARD